MTEPAFSLADKTTIAPLVFVALFVLERLRPAVAWPADKGRLTRNFIFGGIALAASAAFAVAIAVFAASRPLWTRPEDATLAFLALDLVVLDLWTYGLHRAYHVAPALWRLHLPHHLDRHLDTTSTLRFHVGEVLFSALARVPVVIALAIPLAHLALFEAILFVSATFQHSNVRLPPRLERLLSVLIVTPSIHWVHHHVAAADRNSNYASVFSVWDRLFGTASATVRTPALAIGFDRDVEDRSVLGLVLAPMIGIRNKNEWTR
jgi:sterol desaturase/sphingolipid hydroxylase (fatty acid hydroxylase superfamily)